MLTVHQIIEHKGAFIRVISPDRTLGEAAALMYQNGIGALVVEEAGILVGIVEERDLVAQLVHHGTCANAVPVARAMRTDVPMIDEDAPLAVCMRLMTERRRRHLLVRNPDGGRALGIISIGDVVKAQISEMSAALDQYESYITGRPAIGA